MSKKVFGFYIGVAICLGLLCFLPVENAESKQTNIKGKMVIEQSAATLNATATLTGTAFYVKENSGFMSVFYQVVQAGTPHYKIQVYTSPDDTNFVTTPIVITPSSDETSTDMIHVDVPILVTVYVRIDVVGVAGNPADTTITVWRVEQ